MTEKLQIVEQTLEQLGVDTPEGVAFQFAQVRARFDEQMRGEQGRSPEGVHFLRHFWLGRNSGALSLITDNWLKLAPPALKPAVGRGLNELREHVERTIRERQAAIETQASARAAAAEKIDFSLPGIERAIGTRHLVQQTIEEIQDIFLRIGYTVAEGPEIETSYYNFEALNIPEFHPARDMWDTFYVEGPAGTAGKLVLRTHTSPMQIRIMERQPPPVRVIVPGKVYRRDNPDASHLFMFHQIEGLAVDRDLTFADFKGTIEFFVREFLGPKAKTRLRPSYFPFTEPSAEVDATCVVCSGRGCRTCKQTGWFEIMGAGMVDPAVYGFVHYDARNVSGFAFGMGVDRLAILKHGIDDIQVLFQNDVRFLRQFP